MADNKQQTLALSISGMTCAACAARIERVLARLPEVEASVNLATEKAYVRFTPGTADAGAIIAAVERAGFGAKPFDRTNEGQEQAQKLAAQHAELRRFWFALLLTAPLLAQMVFMFGGGAAHPDSHDELLPRALQLLLATPCSSG